MSTLSVLATNLHPAVMTLPTRYIHIKLTGTFRDLVSTLAESSSYPAAIPPRQRSQERTPNTSRMAQGLQEKTTGAMNYLASQRGGHKGSLDSATGIRRESRKRDLQTMSTRNWRSGDVYSPHDLSLVEIKRWKGRTRPEVDVFDQLALNPITEWKVRIMLEQYQT